MQCTRECIKRGNCHAIILKPHECDLSSYDRCANQGKALVWQNNHQIFELRPGDAADHHTTCYQQCGGDCDSCGREYCWGDDCTNCTHACWDPLLVEKAEDLNLWPKSNPSIYLLVSCDMGWQKVWGFYRREVQFNIYPDMLNEPLKLRLRVMYNDSTTLESFFASFEYDIDFMSISVGEFVGGDAGNFWGAPFTNRSAVGINNCLPFFYPAMDACSPSGGVGTGYFWNTEDIITTTAFSDGTNTSTNTFSSTTSPETNFTANETTDSTTPMDNRTTKILTYSTETTTSPVSESTARGSSATTKPGTSTTTTTTVISTTESITYGIYEIQLWVTPL